MSQHPHDKSFTEEQGHYPPSERGEVASTDVDSGNTPRNKDEALAIVGERAQLIDAAIARKVVRKIDLVLIPVMFMRTSSTHLLESHANLHSEYGLIYYDKVC